MAVNTTVAPYFDDYDEDKQYHRLLFRGGRAVQARELTQMQTILQNQITRFGQNIFLEGSMVVPGGASIDTNYEYVKLDDASLGAVVSGATLVGPTQSNLTATLIQSVAVDGGDPATLYVRYTGGGGGTGGRFQDGETITWTNPDTTSGSYTVSTSGTGTGTKVDLQKGVYFVRGYFAVATSQSLIVEKYGIPTGTIELGLTVAETIVTSDTDATLLDNANGTNNLNAPGADRLKFALTLIDKTDVSAGEDYFTLVTIKDAEIVEQVTRSTYAILGEEMARRTYDESGNYTVDPFIVSPSAHASDATKLTLAIDPGRAYVRGFLVDKPQASSIDIDKALTTAIKNNSKTSTYHGNYVRVNALTGAPGLDTFESVSLKDSGGTIRGTARLRSIALETGAIYRLYLFGVVMNSGYAFNVIRTITGTALTATTIDETNADTVNNAIMYDTDKNSLIFKIPHARIKAITDISARVIRHEVDTTDGSGDVTLDTLSATVTWANTGEWIVFRNDTGAIVTGSASYGGSGSQTILVSGLTATTAHTFIAFVDKTTVTNSNRTKTLTTVTDTALTPDGSDVVSLIHYDIYDLVSVKDVDDADADITSRYTLDGGQRDNFYAKGQLLLRAGAVAPAGNVKVTYRYFAHGAGDYFNVDSYNSFIGLGEFDYGDIPIHTFADGTKVRLSDTFDFRPKYTASTVSSINEIPENNETIQSDVSYYLPRIDTLYIDSNGQFGLVAGNPSLKPQPGQTPANAMGIYTINVNPGTVSVSDINTSFIENKRYTMRDIGLIEARMDRIEEFATLSALEVNTQSLEVLDASGNNRFKSGFFVDNFNSHAFADFKNSEYRAAIDPLAGEVRPGFKEYNVRLVYTASATDGSASSGIVRKGDFLMLDYTEVVEVSQGLASSAINVNPYSVITNTGGITLSPETDEWRDVETDTNLVGVQETRAINPTQTGNWDNWRWNWAGAPNIVSGFNRNSPLDFNEV